MPGKLIIMFKDKAVDATSFEHLSDLPIHNQYIPRPNVHPPQFLEWEANREELERMSWVADFGGVDIMYMLDRSEGVRERLVEAGNGAVGGAYKIADIVLVQLGEKIHCIKNNNAMKVVLRFAVQNPAGERPEETIIIDVLEEARTQRDSILHSKGMECEDCGFCSVESALDLYKCKTDEPDSPVSRIAMISYGAVRPFDKINADLNDGGIVLCLNCVAGRNEGAA